MRHESLARPYPVPARLDRLADHRTSRGRNPDMVKEWTRDDLPTAAESVTAYLRGRGPSSSTTDVLSLPGLHGVLDAVVYRLNEHHPKADDQCEDCGVDEALKMVGDLGRAMRRVQNQRAEAERERDVAVARAEKAELKLADVNSEANQKAAAWDRVAAHPALRMGLLPEADHTYAGGVLERITQLVEAAETSGPAVTREDVTQAVRRGHNMPNAEVGVVNEMCDLLGIEAEQAADPVEELAGQIESATRTAIRQVCDGLATVAPFLDPLTVERAMEVTAASRKVAAHVLGQGADIDRSTLKARAEVAKARTTPAPLREEWAAAWEEHGATRIGSVQESPEDIEGVPPGGWVVHRYVSDWMPADPAEGDVSADQ